MRYAVHAGHRAVRPHHHGRHAETPPGGLKQLAFWVTLHCLAGCAVGEVHGLAIGTVTGWGNLETIALAVGLAFVFGYAFTVVPLVRGGMAWRLATMVALAADTVSVAIMQSGIEPQAVLTPTAQESDAVGSPTRPAHGPQRSQRPIPLFELLHHKALAVRHLAELQAARVPGGSVPQAGMPY